MLLTGRVAVVTGAGSGIGREIARVFAAEGARIAGFDLSAGAGDALVEELAATGADRPLALTGDVRDPEAVDAAAATVCAEADRIDILVNCAGTREIRNALE